MFDLASTIDRTEVPLVIVFVDLTGFAAQCARVADDELAGTLDELYELVGSRIAAAGGHVVKFMGDGALIVFEPDDTDRGVEALLALKVAADAFLAGRNWACRLHVKVHVGSVVAGQFGQAGAKRFDVVGRNVNTAAMLESTGMALSNEAFRTLSPTLRRRFKKHAWPVTYLRVEDQPRFRRR